LDVNSLIAFFDHDHVHHTTMRRWFVNHYREGWATCPLTENGTIRVLSQSAYPSGRRSPADVIKLLRDLKDAQPGSHTFFSDSLSFTDEAVFEPSYVVRSVHLTDIYLLALASSRNAKLVSFDRHLPWQAIRGGSAKLVEHPA
jgi:predicted nucleic acid-binding protein